MNSVSDPKVYSRFWSIYFTALLDTSEAYRQMADIKYQMEDSVKHNFLDPLAHVQQTDIKEVNVCLPG